ncbi:sulfatase-like hydrolase/transferase [Streptococcus alactolyticus]
MDSFDGSKVILTGLIASFALNGPLFLDMLSEKVADFIENKDYVAYFLTVSGCVITTLVLCVLVVAILFKAYKAIRKKTINYSVALGFSLLLAVIFNYLFQYGIKSYGEVLGHYIFPSATLFQIGALTLFNVLLYVSINHFLRTTTLIVALGSVITIVNSIKFSMRNEPLLFSDWVWIKDIRLVVSYIDIKVILYFLLAVAAVAVFFYFFKNRLLQGRIMTSWRLRVANVVAILAVFLFTLGVFFHQEDGDIADNIPVLSRLNNYENIEWMGQGTVARERSLTFVWLKQVTSKTMEKPKDYSQETMEKIAQKYTEQAQLINASRTNNIADQTVIYVLSESFADPSRITSVNLTTDPIPVIRSVKDSTTSGLMKSDAYGGGTANMEFETLTGLPMYNLSSSVSTLYTDVVPKMKYIPSISDFYAPDDRYVIHLGDALTYSRNDVYRKLGFDTFIAAKNGTEDTTHLEQYGVYPSDASTYQTVLDNIDTNKNQFFSVITYQNHSPWNLDKESDVGGSGDGFSPNENYYMNNYAKLLYQTDLATQEWLQELSQMDKKITVVFYGDHLPGFYPQSAFADNPAGQYQTDYFIWSNYPTEVLSYPLVNSSDFPAELLAVTNSKVSPYYALLTDVLNNASVDKDQLTDEQKEMANDLKLVEYDLVSGKGYLKKHDNFFKVSY